jgi:hypothetical protein
MAGDEVVECLLYWPAHLELVSLLCLKRATSKRYLSGIVIENTHYVVCLSCNRVEFWWLELQN